MHDLHVTTGTTLPCSAGPARIASTPIASCRWRADECYPGKPAGGLWASPLEPTGTATAWIFGGDLGLGRLGEGIQDRPPMPERVEQPPDADAPQPGRDLAPAVPSPRAAPRGDEAVLKDLVDQAGVRTSTRQPDDKATGRTGGRAPRRRAGRHR